MTIQIQNNSLLDSRSNYLQSLFTTITRTCNLSAPATVHILYYIVPAKTLRQTPREKIAELKKKY